MVLIPVLIKSEKKKKTLWHYGSAQSLPSLQERICWPFNCRLLCWRDYMDHISCICLLRLKFRLTRVGWTYHQVLFLFVKFLLAAPTWKCSMLLKKTYRKRACVTTHRHLPRSSHYSCSPLKQKASHKPAETSLPIELEQSTGRTDQISSGKHYNILF